MKKQIRLALLAYTALNCTLSDRLLAQDVNAAETSASFIIFDAGYPQGIDAHGTVTGYSSFDCTSFYRLADGKVVTFAVPGAGCDNGYTHALGINAGGTIVGTYSDGVIIGGFIRDPKGNFTKFGVPNSQCTEAFAINSSGAVAGAYRDSSNTLHGFLRDPWGLYTSFDLPGALSLPNALQGVQQRAFSINAGGNIAGSYIGQFDNAVGFSREPGGTFTVLNIDGNEVYANGIDDAGRIFGYYDNPVSLGSAFLRDQFGNYTFFDFKDSPNYYMPVASDHNDTLVGSWMSESSSEGGGGFYRLKDGKIGFFDPPGSGWTVPTAVNSQGDITGYFYEFDLVNQHAFIRLAQPHPVPNAVP